MKSTCILLSFILLILSCLPCADADKDVILDATGKVIAQTHEHSKELHTDLCSPFCICNCCGAQVLSFTSPLLFNIDVLPPTYETRTAITYKSNLAWMFSGSIWQPPQLA